MKQSIKFEDLSEKYQKVFAEFRNLANKFVPKGHKLKDISIEFEKLYDAYCPKCKKTFSKGSTICKTEFGDDACNYCQTKLETN